MRRSGTSRRGRLLRGGVWFFGLFCVAAGGSGGMGAAYDASAEPPSLQSPWEWGTRGEEGTSQGEAGEPAPSTRGGREEAGGEDAPLPGRDDPEEFYKKPPRKLKRLDRLPA